MAYKTVHTRVTQTPLRRPSRRHNGMTQISICKVIDWVAVIGERHVAGFSTKRAALAAEKSE